MRGGSLKTTLPLLQCNVTVTVDLSCFPQLPHIDTAALLRQSANTAPQCSCSTKSPLKHWRVVKRSWQSEESENNSALLSYLRKAGHTAQIRSKNIVKPQIYLDPNLASLPNFRSPQMSPTHTFTGSETLPCLCTVLAGSAALKETNKRNQHWKLCQGNKKLLCQCYICKADFQQEPRWHRWQQCHRVAWVPLWCESAACPCFVTDI